MTALRQRMIRELELQRKSKHTADAYLLAVSQLAAYFNRSPDELTEDEVRQATCMSPVGTLRESKAHWIYWAASHRVLKKNDC